VRRGVRAFAERGPEAVLPSLDPEVVIVDPDLPGGGTFRGRDGFLTFTKQVLEAFEDYEVEAEELFDGGDRIVVFLRHRGRGGASGAPIKLRDAQVWTIQDKRATKIVLYLDRRAALEAAGLSE